MAGGGEGRAARPAKRARPQEETVFDRELEHLSADLRWREWMMRVEAVIFAAVEPVQRETLARVVGENCSVDLIVEDLREELRNRPYDIVTVAGGWQHRTRSAYGAVIRATDAPTRSAPTTLAEHEAAVLMAVGYFQPVTRGDLSKIFGKEVSRDTIANLRADGFLAPGPRSPTPGAPYTYVTTKIFLSAFGFETLRDLPDIEALEDAGLLTRNAPIDVAADLAVEAEEDE